MDAWALLPPLPPKPPGNGLLKAAVACFAVGLVAVVAIFLIPALTDGTPGLVLYSLTLARGSLVFALRCRGSPCSSGRRARDGRNT